MINPDENGLWPDDFVKEAQRRAARFVCASTTSKKTGEIYTCQSEFNQRFKHLPTVQQAERQGWDGELRSHLRLVVTKKILEGEAHANVADLMPDKRWIGERVTRAKQLWQAEQWRAQMRAKHGTIWNYLKTMRPKPSTGLPLKTADYQIDTE